MNGSSLQGRQDRSLRRFGSSSVFFKLTAAIENTTTYTAANGDMLDQSFIGTALINLETGEVRYIGTETFEGGSGRFENAIGTSELTGTASVFTGTGIYTVQGRIAY